MTATIQINRKKLQLVFAAVAFFLATAVSAFIIRGVFASGDAVIELSTDTTSLTTNDSVTVAVSVDASEDIIGASIRIAYDQTKLRLDAVREDSVPLDIAIFTDTDSNPLEITRATFGTGDKSFSYAELDFTALEEGEAIVSISSGSDVNDGSTNQWDGNETELELTINDPQPVPDTPPSTPTSEPTEDTEEESEVQESTPPTTDTGSGTDDDTSDDENESQQQETPTQNDQGTQTPEQSTQESPKPVNTSTDTTPDFPPAEEVTNSAPELVKRTFAASEITVSTTVPVRAKIQYGTNNELLFTTTETDLTTNPIVTLDQDFIEPGKTYVYKVILTDEEGNITETDVQSFRAKGYPLRITLRDADNKPLANTDVVVESERREGRTDEQGEALFEDMELGTHTVSFTFDGIAYSETISIEDNLTVDDEGNENTPQQVAAIAIDVTQDSASNSAIIAIVPLVAILAALGLGVIYKMMRDRRKLAPVNTVVDAPQDGSPTTIEPEQGGHKDQGNSEQASAQQQTPQNNDLKEYLKPEPPKPDTVIDPKNTDQE